MKNHRRIWRRDKSRKLIRNNRKKKRKMKIHFLMKSSKIRHKRKKKKT